MPITLERSIKSRTKGSLMIDIFKGIDKSTARHRIFGDGAVLYESKNTFPYLQGRLQRRKDYVTTNSRASDAAFPTFPAGSLTGDPVVKKILEYNDLIVIIYEDDGDTGKVLVDSFDVGANTLTNRVAIADAYAFDAGGAINAVSFALTGGADPILVIAPKGGTLKYLTSGWVLNAASATAQEGVNEVFLQTHFFKTDNSVNFSQISRHDVGTFTGGGSFYLTDFAEPIIKFVTFGYQTSSAGAFTNLIIFKTASTWLLSSITVGAAMEQVSGNVGLAGINAIVNTPLGLIFVGRDKQSLLNIYLLDRVSMTLHTIGHPLYEVLNNIPKTNYNDIVLSYARNRMVRIALTQTGDSNINEQEYWLDFYNGIKKRTYWGPFPLKVQSLTHAVAFSGGGTITNAGFFFLELSGTTYSLKEETETDSFDSSDTDIDVQSIRTKLFDFGTKNALISMIWITALDNGAKFKIYSEIPKAGGTDDDTTQTLIGSGNAGTPVTGEYQMGTTGLYKTIPVRLIPALRVNQFGIKIDSDADVNDDDPFDISQLGFEFTSTQRIIIE